MAECEWLRVNLPKASKGFVTKVTVTTTRTPDPNDKIRTNFFIGTVFNRAKVEELFAGKTWATPDFLTTTREKKKKVGVGSLQMLELRTWWAIATNPSDFLLSGRGVIECRNVRPVLGKDYTKQVKNLAKALVSDNFKEALELVVGEEIKFCMGISRDLTIHLSDADFDLMSDSRAKWRLKETSDRSARLPEYELFGPFPSLAFAPTKEDMGERFQVFYVELMAYERAFQKVRHQSLILKDIYDKHGAGTSKWVTDQLVEKVQENPMGYLHNATFEPLARMLLQGDS
jgi:hypothetical protein